MRNTNQPVCHYWYGVSSVDEKKLLHEITDVYGGLSSWHIGWKQFAISDTRGNHSFYFFL